MDKTVNDRQVVALMLLGFSKPRRYLGGNQFEYCFENLADYRARAKDIRKQARTILRGTDFTLASFRDGRDENYNPLSSIIVHIRDSRLKPLPVPAYSEPKLTAREQAIYNDYMYSGNQNFWADRARARSVAQTGGMSKSDYQYAGYNDAASQVSRDRALVRRFYD